MAGYEELPVFKCEMCGLCCRMSPISLLPHEAVVLEWLADKMELRFECVHGYVVYDALSGMNLAFSYIMQLNNGHCPFLEGNKCRIHNIYKPYICRSFPYTPKHVKYHMDDVNKYIMASTEYGLSLACSVVKKHKEVLEKYWFRDNESPDKILQHYFKDGYLAAVEGDNTRSLLLTLLSKLWRDGLADIRQANITAPVVNLYEYLRRFYPDLPNILRIDKIVHKVRACLKAY